MRSDIQGQDFQESVPITELMTGASLGAIEPIYSLREVEYMHLISGPGRAATWALNIFFAGLGYAISLGPKVVPTVTGASSGAVTPSEAWTFAGVVVLAVLVRGAGLFFRPKRATVMAKIEECFKDQPEKALLVRRGDSR